MPNEVPLAVPLQIRHDQDGTQALSLAAQLGQSTSGTFGSHPQNFTAGQSAAMITGHPHQQAEMPPRYDATKGAAIKTARYDITA